MAEAAVPEGPYIQLLGNQAPRYHTMEGIMDPNSLMVVYVGPLGVLAQRSKDED